jgi:hypothetical protein
MMKKFFSTFILGMTSAFAELSSGSSGNFLQNELGILQNNPTSNIRDDGMAMPRKIATENERPAQFSFDSHFTPYAGAQNILALHQAMERIENWIFPSTYITPDDLLHPEQCPALSTSSRWNRWTRDLLIWSSLAATFQISQHELFGHGYRIRDLGPKYGKVRGYRYYFIAAATEFEPTPNITTSQMLTIGIAGGEAESILANRVRQEWLGNQCLNPSQASLYMGNSMGLTAYTLSLHKTPNHAPQSGNDMKNYLFYLNTTYPDAHLSYRSLRNLSLLNLLDPFLFYSMAATSNYVKTGMPSVIPMISLGGGVKYLPALRFGLTPFGPQYYLENFFLKGSTPTYVYLKWGQHGANTYYGLGVENRNILNWKNGSIGFKMDLWHQPNVLFAPGSMTVEQISDLPKGAVVPQLYPASVLTEKRFGAAASVVGTYGIANSPAQLNLELGYKTKGYLPGEALRKAPILRGGFSLNF